MPYVPRAAVAATCAHCGVAFTARHLRRKYCCNSCNVLAARARKKTTAAPAGPAACPLPPRFRAWVGPTRALGPPFRADGREFVDYAIGPGYWLQPHQAHAPVNWLCPPGQTRASRAFFVGDDGLVWVPDSAYSTRVLYAHAVDEEGPAFADSGGWDADPGPWT